MGNIACSTAQNNSSKKIPICLKCFSMPIISIDQNNKVHITCMCEEELLLENYLNQFISVSDKCTDHPDAQSVAYCVECQKFLCVSCVDYHDRFIEAEHRLLTEKDLILPQCSAHDKNKEYYCEDCKEYLCPDCKGTHNEDHKCINIQSISSKVNTAKAKEKLQEGEKYLNEYYPKIKDEYIKQIEKKYEDNLKKNKNILEFYSIMIDSYIPNQIINYNVFRNINNYYLQFSKIKEGENYAEFIEDNNIIYRHYQQFNLEQFESVTTIKEHSSYIYSLCLLKDGRLVSCSADKSIKIYNPKQNYNCDLTIKEHNNNIYSVCVLEDGRLVSCSGDKTIKIWEINNNSYQLKATLTGHTNQVEKVISLPSNRIASGSLDKTIKIWDYLTCNCIVTLTEHTKFVESLLLMKDNKYMVSGSWDKTLRVWDISTYKNEKTIEDVFGRWVNGLIQIDSKRVAVGGEKVLQIVNITTAQVEEKIAVEGIVYSLLLLTDGNVLIGDSMKKIYFYQIKEKSLRKKNDSHNDGITCFIYLNKNTIATCSNDKSIKIWNQIDEYLEKH